MGSCGGRKERPGECPGGVQSCCLPACLPHALFLGHSFQFPFLLLIVESVPGLGAVRNRRKPALMEGLRSTHLSLGRRLKGPSPALSSTLLGQLTRAEVTFPPSRHLPCSPSPLSQDGFSDKQRNSLTLFHLRLIQPFPFHTSNLTTSPAGVLLATDCCPSVPTHLQSHPLVLSGG